MKVKIFVDILHMETGRYKIAVMDCPWLVTAWLGSEIFVRRNDVYMRKRLTGRRVYRIKVEDGLSQDDIVALKSSNDKVIFASDRKLFIGYLEGRKLSGITQLDKNSMHAIKPGDNVEIRKTGMNRIQLANVLNEINSNKENR